MEGNKEGRKEAGLRQKERKIEGRKERMKDGRKVTR